MGVIRSLGLLGIGLFYLSSSFAGDIQIKVDDAKPIGAFTVGIGSRVSLNSQDGKINWPALFVGNAILPNGQSSYQMYLNETLPKATLYYVAASHFDTSSNMQKVLNPYEQAGGTCTGYAIYDFLQQTHLSGFQGTGSLDEKVADEKGRTTLLVDNINEYYLTPQHRYSISGILNKYGKTFGFKCSDNYSTDSYDLLEKRILNQLNAGKPVTISFNIGPNMSQSPFSLKMPDQPAAEMDERLWIPRKKGERKNGGHTIVAAAWFESQNKKYLVVIDSDWSEPRVWDMESFLNDHAALNEIQIVTCQ